MTEAKRFVAKRMGAMYGDYYGVWDTALRVWTTWNHTHSVPMRFATMQAAEVTASNRSNGVEKV